MNLIDILDSTLLYISCRNFRTKVGLIFSEAVYVIIALANPAQKLLNKMHLANSLEILRRVNILLKSISQSSHYL